MNLKNQMIALPSSLKRKSERTEGRKGTLMSHVIMGIDES